MKIDTTTRIYLEDQEILDLLSPVIAKAPNGINSLAALHPTVIQKMVTHPNRVVVVEPSSFYVTLSNVDTSGYSVYDRTFTKLYTVTVDLKDNPTDDLTVPHLRTMTFGCHTYDALFLDSLKHGLS